MPTLRGELKIREISLTVVSGSPGSGYEDFPTYVMVQAGPPDPGILAPRSTVLTYFKYCTYLRIQLSEANTSELLPAFGNGESLNHTLLSSDVVHMAFRCACKPSSTSTI